MREAVAAYCWPGQLRFLFAHLLLDLPTPAIALWETFREALLADFALGNNEAEAERLTLHAISRHLQSQGANLGQFGLPEPAMVDREVNMELDAFLHRRDTLLQHSQESHQMMNPEQRVAYDRVLGLLGRVAATFSTAKQVVERLFWSMPFAIASKARATSLASLASQPSALYYTKEDELLIQCLAFLLMRAHLT